MINFIEQIQQHSLMFEMISIPKSEQKVKNVDYDFSLKIISTNQVQLAIKSKFFNHCIVVQKLKMFGGFYGNGQMVLNPEDGLGSVWISGYELAQNVQQLKDYKIHAVCSGIDLGFKYPENFSHLVFDLDDSHMQDARHVFEAAYNFIEENRKKTNVLIHCAAGVSRSSMILISYMMKKEAKKYQECLQIVKRARACCQPNQGFVKQLRQYEKNLLEKNSD